MAAFFVGAISVPARSKKQARINTSWGKLRPKEKPLNEGLSRNLFPKRIDQPLFPAVCCNVVRVRSVANM